MLPPEYRQRRDEARDRTAVTRWQAAGIYDNKRIGVRGRRTKDSGSSIRRYGTAFTGLRARERAGGAGRVEERGDYSAGGAVR